MRFSLFGPLLVAVGILWRVVAIVHGSPVMPGIAVALFAGLLFREAGVRWIALAALIATHFWMLAQAIYPSVAFVTETCRLAGFAVALFLGGYLRDDPAWWKIAGGVGLLGLASGGRFAPSLSWEVLVADQAYGLLALIALAFVLRAEKRRSPSGQMGEAAQ